MMPFFIRFFGPHSLGGLIYQSDAVSKLVLLLLLVMSLCSWTLIIYKYVRLQWAIYDLRSALRTLAPIRSFEELLVAQSFLKHHLAGYLLKEYSAHLRFLLQEKKQLTTHEMERLQTAIDCSIEDALNLQTEYVSFLGMSAAVAPLLGLLGTVWGLIHAFMDISATGQASIATVAPGIAEALITTLAGMLVAIPALVFYHLFLRMIDRLEFFIRKLSYHFESIVQGLVR